MIVQCSKIRGCFVGATDGPIGSIVDVLFEDSTWLVRWLVMDTGGFFPGKTVLVPPSALGQVNHIGHQYAVRLTQQQIKDSPSVDTDRPVSRAMESDLYDHYGWAPYWSMGFYMGGYGHGGSAIEPEGIPFKPRKNHNENKNKTDGGPKLRSAREVTGYHIHASDGVIGGVGDFLIEDGDWSIHYLVADTGGWWPGRSVLVSPRSVRTISWSEATIDLHVTRRQIKDGPAYDGTKNVDRAYENNYDRYYNGCLAAEPG
jgi:hypothetical protein